MAGCTSFAPEIRIADCTLRDGEQQAGIVLTKDAKLEIARELSALGVYEIEAGTPASSSEDREAVEMIVAAGLRSRVSALARARRDDIADIAACGCWGVRLSLPISKIQRAQKAGLEDDEKYLKTALDMSAYAKERGLVCIFSPFDTTRCDIDFLRRVLGALAKQETVDRVRLVDTTGCATPHVVRFLVAEMKKVADIPIEIHCHNDFGLAVANTIAGAEAGAEYLSVTVNGIGERAGNAALEETAVALRVLYDTDLGLDLSRLYHLARLVEGHSGVTLQRHKAVVGDGAFAHESGMVVAALLKDPFTAEAYVPELVGQKRRIILGKKTGAASVKAKLEEIGLGAMPDEVNRLVELVKSEAIRTRRPIDDRVFAKLAAEVVSG
ncbi:MAG: homocitrate synthase [Hyphomicrobiaceae bacterium]|nr:homocitrate synthase [Hyphomicrobiaceae bacterium]